MKAVTATSGTQGGKAPLRWLKHSLWSIIIVLVLLAAPTSQAALSQDGPQDPQQPQGPWDIQTVYGPAYFFNMTDRSLAYRWDGAPCIAFGGDGLYFTCYNSTNKVWDKWLVDDDPRVGEYASLAFNDNSWPFIAYYDGYNGRLKLAFNMGGGWIIKVMDSPSPDQKMAPVTSTPLDTENMSADERMLAFMKGDIPYFNAISPNIQVAVEGVGKHTSIDVDAENRVHISYYDGIRGSLKYLVWDGVNTLREEVDNYNDQGDVGLWTSIVVDDLYDNVHIGYMSEKYDDVKYARRKANGEWKKCTVDAGGNVGSFTSIALDRQGTAQPIPHISYLDFTNLGNGDSNLMHAYLPAGGACDDNQSQWKTEMVDGSSIKARLGWYTSIAIDGSHQIYISYFDATNQRLKYAKGKFGSWTGGAIHDNGFDGLYTSIALGPNGLPGISFYNASLGALSYIYKLTTTKYWSAADAVYYFSKDVGLGTSLALSQNGKPHISFLDSTWGALNYATTYGFTWSIRRLSPGFGGFYSSIKLGFAERPRVAYYDTWYGNLMFAAWDGATWRYWNVDNYYDTGKYVSLAMGPGDIPHISYYDATRGNLMYVEGNLSTTSWTTQTLDIVGDVGQYTSIALDAFNQPAIAYYDAEHGELKFMYKTFLDAWIVTPLILDDGLRPGDLAYPDHDVGQFASLAFDRALDPGESNYDVHIIYYDNSVNDLLLINGNWNQGNFNWDWTAPAVIDGDGIGLRDVGKFASLAVDKSENLHMCYYNATDGDLMYAYGPSTPPLTIETVASAGDVGYYCSMALNYRPNPPNPDELIKAITYYDNSNGDLKIALSYILPPAYYYLPIVINIP